MAKARSRLTISRTDDNQGTSLSSAALLPSGIRDRVSHCRCFLRAFTRQPIGPTIAVFTRSANCVFLLAANSGVCARRCWSWLRLKRSGRAAAWDRKGKCTSCASRAWSLSRGQDPLLLTMEVCRTRLARPIRDAASRIGDRASWAEASVTPLHEIHSVGHTVYRCF